MTVLAMVPASRRVPRGEPGSALARLRDLLAERAQVEGHTATPLPCACIYRFSSPTTFQKAPAFGVTLGVVAQGAKQVRVDGRAHDVDTRSAIVVTREIEFESAIVEASPGAPYLGIALCFSPEMVARALARLADAGAATTRETVPAFVSPVDEEVVAAVVRVVRAMDDPLDRSVLVPLALEEILFRLLRSDAAAAVRSAVGRAADAQQILEAMQRIRARSDRAWTVPDLARDAGMSASHFAHRFRAVARTTPMRFVREVRLERARALLVEPGARASEVAARVGFESASHFTREFKRRFGVSPSQHQRRARGDG